MLCAIALPVIWTLLVASDLSGHMAGLVQPESMPPEVTLTDQHAEGSFPIPTHIVSKPPPVLKLSVTKVINPERTAFQIFVYLSDGVTGEQGAGVKVPLGNVALYPADRPGAFLLRDTAAFEKLKASVSRAKPSAARLLLEIRRLRPNKPWTQVEVTFAPPQWLAEPPT